MSKEKGGSQSRDVIRRLRKNKLAMTGLIILLLLIAASLLAPWIAPYGYDDQDVTRRFLSPCPEFWMGTDSLGRDIFSRVLYGGRISLMVGILATGSSAVIGIILGAIAGYFGGKRDNVIMRALDVLMAMPQILLAIAIAATLGTGVRNAVIAVSVANVPRFARVVRAPILAQRNQEYIEAAVAVNAKDQRIIFRHILPNVMAPIIVEVTLGVGIAIISTAGLSFLGLGVQPPVPEWGAMLSAGRQYIRDYWHVVTFPGIAIMLTVFSLNVFGDGLRDALDPRLKN